MFSRERAFQKPVRLLLDTNREGNYQNAGYVHENGRPKYNPSVWADTASSSSYAHRILVSFIWSLTFWANTDIMDKEGWPRISDKNNTWSTKWWSEFSIWSVIPSMLKHLKLGLDKMMCPLPENWVTWLTSLRLCWVKFHLMYYESTKNFVSLFLNK